MFHMDYAPILPAVMLYLETHFRFSALIPNLLFKSEPEIIFDTPRRLDPGASLPVLLLINDCDRFPAELQSVAFTVSRSGNTPQLYNLKDCEQFRVHHPFETQCKAYLFWIGTTDLPKGLVFVTCKADLTMNGRPVMVLNDNLPGSSRTSYTCFIASDKLPGHGHCRFGDMHVHSQFSQSHVEFGPPIEAVDAMACGNGLDFVCITDHSYDLMCAMDDYLRPDPASLRWETMRKEVNADMHRTVLIPGEEISCINARGRVVHLCGYGLTDMLPGSLDGARKGRSKEKQTTAVDAIAEIHRQNGVAAAAHPGSRNSLLAKLLLKRGNWESQDLGGSLDGFQAVNTGFDQSWKRAKKQWVERLANGARLPLLAGNDAHGDFNRYRAVDLPMVSMQEGFDRYFAACRTGVYTREKSRESILQSIKNGETFITSGPSVGICTNAVLEHSIIAKADRELSPADRLYAVADSTPEFGSIRRLRVLNFDAATGKEQVVLDKAYSGRMHQTAEALEFKTLAASGYIRAETVCEPREDVTPQAYTSPCFYTK